MIAARVWTRAAVAVLAAALVGGTARADSPELALIGLGKPLALVGSGAETTRQIDLNGGPIGSSGGVFSITYQPLSPDPVSIWLNSGRKRMVTLKLKGTPGVTYLGALPTQCVRIKSGEYGTVIKCRVRYSGVKS